MQNALQIGSFYRGSLHPVEQLFELCGSNAIQIIGTLNPTNPSPSFDHNHLQLQTDPGSNVPKLLCAETCDLSAEIILFQRPSPYRMEYVSLTPIPLVLGDKPKLSSSKSSTDAFADYIDEDTGATKAHLMEKLKLHTVVERPASQKERLLPTVLAQINCASEIAELINGNSFVLQGRQKRSLSVGEQVVQSATTLRNHLLRVSWHIATTWLWPFVVRVLILALVSHRILAEVILRILEWRPPFELKALKDISATAQQLDIRLQQFCYWPVQYLTLRKRKNSWESITDRHPDYFRFYNSLWLVANDVIIGIAVGSYIIDNAEWVASQINVVLDEWAIQGLVNMMQWLVEYPAGLKLNNELAKFLGWLVLLIIDYWKSRFSLLVATNGY